MSKFGSMSRAKIKERHQEKFILILSWLCRYSFSNAAILTMLLKIDERNVRATLQKLIVLDLIKFEVLPSGHKIYGIAKNGIGYIQEFDTRLAEIARPFQYGRTPISTLTHQYNIQLVELKMSKYGWHNFAADREIRRYKNIKQIPDLVTSCRNNMTIAVEVEINLKSSSRMKIICNNYCELVDAIPDECMLYCGVLYLTPYPARLKMMLDEFLPAEKRFLFFVSLLQVAPLLLTPRRSRHGGK